MPSITPDLLAGGILTDPELCRLLRTDKSTLNYWRETAGLPFFRLGIRGKRGSIRYARSEVERWLAERRNVLARRSPATTRASTR